MKHNDFFKYSGLGMEFGITVLMFVFLGVYLDRKFGTMPLCTLGLSLVGFSSAVYLMYKTLGRMQKLDDQNIKEMSNKKNKPNTTQNSAIDDK